MPDLRAVAALVDQLVPERVLLVGSDPAHARDLDLVVRPPAAAALTRLLPAAGFRLREGGWARLTDGMAVVVDPAPAAELDLPPDELERLFTDAAPLPGLARVVRPAAHDTLLLLARQVLREEGRLDHRRLARAHTALSLDPDAFQVAGRHARSWGCEGALEVLQARVEGRRLPRENLRALLRSGGGGVPSAARRLLRRLRPRRTPPGAVVAVSGLDGAGKSTQIEALVQSLRSLGYPTVVLWDRISYDRVLVHLAAPIKALRRPSPAAASEDRPATGMPSGTPAVAAWALVVTVVHVLSAGKTNRHHLRRGRIVVRDRYVLDAAVHLQHRYGPAAPHGLFAWLLRRLSRPAVAWYLDVPAEEAHRRKPEQYDVGQLAAQRAHYLSLAPAFGVRVVDGTAPALQLRQQLLQGLTAALEPAPGRSPWDARPNPVPPPVDAGAARRAGVPWTPTGSEPLYSRPLP